MHSCPPFGGAPVGTPPGSGPWAGRDSLYCRLEILDAVLKVVRQFLKIIEESGVCLVLRNFAHLRRRVARIDQRLKSAAAKRVPRDLEGRGHAVENLERGLEVHPKQQAAVSFRCPTVDPSFPS